MCPVPRCSPAFTGFGCQTVLSRIGPTQVTHVSDPSGRFGSGRPAGGRGCSAAWSATAAAMLSWTWSRFGHVEEPVAFQDLEDLRLDSGQVKIDASVAPGLGDRLQHVGAFGVDEIDTLHAEDDAVEPRGRIDADLAETGRPGRRRSRRTVHRRSAGRRARGRSHSRRAAPGRGRHRFPASCRARESTAAPRRTRARSATVRRR